MSKRGLLSDPADTTARVVIGTLFMALSWRLGRDFILTGRTTDLLLLVGEGSVVVLTMLRRQASTVDRRSAVRLITTISMIAPFLLRPGPAGGLIPEALSATLAGVGLVIVLAGKLSLGYSFGLLPANRGLVNDGAYNFVRHPIYAGYLLTHLPFLLSHPTPWNAVVLICGDTCLVARTVYEERVLARDSAYERYRQRVRWRLLPGLY
jgi:protein-S-isoprenylcysteine O-methyltransferase Ste14